MSNSPELRNKLTRINDAFAAINKVMGYKFGAPLHLEIDEVWREFVGLDNALSTVLEKLATSEKENSKLKQKLKEAEDYDALFR